MFVINETLGIYGGSLTLLLRMCMWLRENKKKTAVICLHDDNTEIVEKLRYIGVKIYKLDVKNTKKGIRLLKRLCEIEEVITLSFGWNNYIEMEIIKKSGNLYFDNFIYCIHPDTFKRGKGFRNEWLKKYAIFSYRGMLLRMSKNHAVFSMDEVNVDETTDYLNIDFKDGIEILRLPVIFKERKDRHNLIRTGYDGNIIMTAARAEFPYKGYMIGLIDSFSELKKKYPYIRLEIISAGDDLDKLRDKIQKNPDKDSIILHGWMDYDRLLHTMENCKLFIGMGTGLLDAVTRYKPAIPVNFNTYGCYAERRMSQDPRYLDTKDVHCINPAVELMSEVLSMTFEEYEKECVDSFEKAKELYDIDMIMGKLIMAKTDDNGCILSRFEIFRQKANNMVNSWRTRGIKPYDYNGIYKEPESETIN